MVQFSDVLVTIRRRLEDGHCPENGLDVALNPEVRNAVCRSFTGGIFQTSMK